MWCHGMRWEKKKPPLPFIILMSAARVYILMRWYQSIWTWHRSVQPHNCVERQHRVTALFTIIYKLMMKCSSLDELIILKEHCFLIKQTISMISFQGSVMMKAYRNLFPPFYMFYCTVILGHEQVKTTFVNHVKYWSSLGASVVGSLCIINLFVEARTKISFIMVYHRWMNEQGRPSAIAKVYFCKAGNRLYLFFSVYPNLLLFLGHIYRIFEGEFIY